MERACHGNKGFRYPVCGKLVFDQFFKALINIPSVFVIGIGGCGIGKVWEMDFSFGAQ
tara:strand:+ start:408 stop:581 length:174 start_codon:yes stop_codon:yes gene_type:complete